MLDVSKKNFGSLSTNWSSLSMSFLSGTLPIHSYEKLSYSIKIKAIENIHERTSKICTCVKVSYVNVSTKMVFCLLRLTCIIGAWKYV